jgi:hypothetical protein
VLFLRAITAGGAALPAVRVLSFVLRLASKALPRVEISHALRDGPPVPHVWQPQPQPLLHSLEVASQCLSLILHKNSMLLELLPYKKTISIGC